VGWPPKIPSGITVQPIWTRLPDPSAGETSIELSRIARTADLVVDRVALVVGCVIVEGVKDAMITVAGSGRDSAENCQGCDDPDRGIREKHD
jgi:hypothetical protein